MTCKPIRTIAEYWRLIARSRLAKIDEQHERLKRLRKALSLHVGAIRAAKVERGET